MGGDPGLELSTFSFCHHGHLFSYNNLDTSLPPLALHNKLSLPRRKLYFAQSHKPPYHGRVCVAPPGCLLSSSPDGPTKGILYVPSEKGKLTRACPATFIPESNLFMPPDVTHFVLCLAAAPKAKLSATSGFNPCVNAGCGKPAVRPLVDTGAMVFVVFGIRGVNRTRRLDNHVLGDLVHTFGHAGQACCGLASEGQAPCTAFSSSPRPGSALQQHKQMEEQRRQRCREPKALFCFSKRTTRGAQEALTETTSHFSGNPFLSATSNLLILSLNLPFLRILEANTS